MFLENSGSARHSLYFFSPVTEVAHNILVVNFNPEVGMKDFFLGLDKEDCRHKSYNALE